MAQAFFILVMVVFAIVSITLAWDVARKWVKPRKLETPLIPPVTPTIEDRLTQVADRFARINVDRDGLQRATERLEARIAQNREAFSRGLLPGDTRTFEARSRMTMGTSQIHGNYVVNATINPFGASDGNIWNAVDRHALLETAITDQIQSIHNRMDRDIALAALSIPGKPNPVAAPPTPPAPKSALDRLLSEGHED